MEKERSGTIGDPGRTPDRRAGRVLVAVVLIAALALAMRGCDGDRDTTAPVSAGDSGLSRSDEDDDPASPRSAAGLVDALAQRMHQVERTAAAPRAGRHEGLRTAAAFTDSRLVDDDADQVDDDDTARGGSVEVYGSAADARRRRAALAGGPDHLYLSGRSLLRVTRRIPVRVADEYEAAWPDVVAGRTGH